jgi:ketosteroid isomerase-like protein
MRADKQTATERMRRLSRLWPSPALILVAATVAWSQKATAMQAKPFSDAADRQAIADLHKRDEEASRRQDFKTLRSLMDDDAVVLAPDALPVRGKEELDRQFSGRRDMSAQVEILDYRFEWSELEIIGDRAIEWGKILGTSRDRQTGQTTRSAYNVMRILRRDGEGQWRVYRSIWNAAPPPSPDNGGQPELARPAAK